MPDNVAQALQLILVDGWRIRGAARVTGTTVDEIHKWWDILLYEERGKWAQKRPIDVGELS